MKIRPVGTELFPADGQTDGHKYMHDEVVAFRNFANALKKLRSFSKIFGVSTPYKYS